MVREEWDLELVKKEMEVREDSKVEVKMEVWMGEERKEGEKMEEVEMRQERKEEKVEKEISRTVKASTLVSSYLLCFKLSSDFRLLNMIDD